MNRFRTRLSLQNLDDRIVPDGTPMVGPMPGFNPGEMPPTAPPPAVTPPVGFGPAPAPAPNPGPTAPGPDPAPDPNGFTLAELVKARADIIASIADNKAATLRNNATIAMNQDLIQFLSGSILSDDDLMSQANTRKMEAQADLKALAKDRIYSGVLFDLASAKSLAAQADYDRAYADKIECNKSIDKYKDAITDLRTANKNLATELTDLNKQLANADAQIAALQKKGN